MKSAPPGEYLSAERVGDIAADRLAVDTQNLPGVTRPIAERVETFLITLGLATERVVVDPPEPNVLATIPDERDLTLLSDDCLGAIPFEADEWTHDPPGECDDDRRYGRGRTDTTGPLAAMSHVVEPLIETDRRPPVDIAFASDEETGRRIAGYTRGPAAYDEMVG